MTLDQWLTIINIFISVVISVIVYYMSIKLSAKSKYDHEVYISNQLRQLLGKKVILADVKKYNSNNEDVTNTIYYKQACGFEEIIPVYGIKVCLRDSEGFKFGVIPFDWIEYVRPNDSEDNCSVIVCKFKGIKWYRNFKSPVKEITKE